MDINSWYTEWSILSHNLYHCHCNRPNTVYKKQWTIKINATMYIKWTLKCINNNYIPHLKCSINNNELFQQRQHEGYVAEITTATNMVAPTALSESLSRTQQQGCQH